MQSSLPGAMRRYLPFVIVTAVALLAVGSGAMLYRAKRPRVLTIPNENASKTNATESSHVRGQPNAPVTLEEFGDFQCPPCGVLAGPIKQIEHDYQPRLRVIFHHFPLITHQHAREAAWAAEAAGLQGHFWEMHDLLYREQSVWSKASDVRPLFNDYAGILGLNIDRFKKDMESDKVKTRVDLDQHKGAELGLQNTPTIFINNRVVAPNAMAPADLRAAVDAAIKATPPDNSASNAKEKDKPK
jgi:protein-disulfide isomerase